MVRRFSFGIGFAAAIAAFIVSSPQETPVEELTPPVFWWEHGNGLCSQVRATDASGRLWDDTGCEDGRFGFTPVGTLSEEERQTIVDAFDRFPAPTPPPTCSNGMAHHFLQRNPDGTETYWHACGASQAQGSTAGLESPFLDAAGVLGRDP